MALACIDFETEAIGQRPKFPAPVGVAIGAPGRAPRYYAWGHPSENGIYELSATGLVRVSGDPRTAGEAALREAFQGDVLGHNIAKFDLPVAEAHLNLRSPAWDRVHDTLFQLFLLDPHADSLALKESAERIFDEPPQERDAVYDWLAEQGFISKPKLNEDGRLVYPKNAGAFISKAPGNLVALYAIGDVTRTLQLHERCFPKLVELGMQKAYDRERRLAPILLANERQGMRVDLPGLERDLQVYESDLALADAWIISRLGGKEFNLDSDMELAAALKAAGVVPEFPKTPTGKDSVSKKTLVKKLFADPDVWLALYYRNALDTVLKMSMRPWLAQARENNGYIFTEWNQVRQSHGRDAFKGARSGRITCSYFQNISKTFLDKGDGYEHPAFLEVHELPLVRRYLLPDAGGAWGHIDYNQQEMRLVAHYEEGALAEAYRRNPATDIHNDVQALIKQATGKLYDRRPVKIVDFRTVYGGGVSGLAEMFQWSYSEAKELIDAWKKALPDVVELDKELKRRFRSGQHLRTYGGRVYFVKPPAIAKKGPRKGEMITFEYTALNYLIQPSGADVTKEALIRYDEAKKEGRLIVTVHDEVNLSIPEKAAASELKILKECMESVKLDVPWRVDTKIGDSWGSLKKVEAL